MFGLTKSESDAAYRRQNVEGCGQALELIKRKYAAGFISEAEFLRLKETMDELKHEVVLDEIYKINPVIYPF